MSSGANPMVNDLAFGVVTVDHKDLDINYAGTLAGNIFLSDMAGIIHELGHAFWVQHNNSVAADGYISFMNNVSNRYFDTPRIMRFTPSDLLWMQELDVFKSNNDTQDFSNNYEIEVESNECTFDNGNLHINFNFTSTQKPALVIVYNDPWFSSFTIDFAANSYT